MQEANATSIEYFRDLERVADLLNGILFHGEEIITADNLLEKNPVIHKITEKDGKITATENIPDLSIMVMLNDVSGDVPGADPYTLRHARPCAERKRNGLL